MDQDIVNFAPIKCTREMRLDWQSSPFINMGFPDGFNELMKGHHKDKHNSNSEILDDWSLVIIQMKLIFFILYIYISNIKNKEKIENLD